MQYKIVGTTMQSLFIELIGNQDSIYSESGCLENCSLALT